MAKEKERDGDSGGLHLDSVNTVKVKQIPWQRLLFIARKKINTFPLSMTKTIVIIERSYKIVQGFD